jgi:aryl-alcohol dehydrogenase-like predicted oxidoreductase
VELRAIPDSSLSVSLIGLGCNNFGRRLGSAATRAVVDAALDAGVTFLDTAESYGGGNSERFIGDALLGRREQAVLATKFGGGPPGGSARGTREYVRNAVEGSLERLRTDYIDLYYYHAPDGLTPIAETLDALDELVREGKVVAVGCSNFDAAQLREADEVARSRGRHRFVALQNQFSLLERAAEDEELPLCRDLDIAFVPYFPLVSGLLTGKYERGRPAPEGARLSGSSLLEDEERFDHVETLNEHARGHGRSLHELALSALASTPGVTSVLVGATSPEQVRANAAAAGWELTAEELAAVPRIVGHGVR